MTAEESVRSKGWPEYDLDFVIEHREDYPDRCVIYDAGAEGSEVSTRWLTANEGAYCCLTDAR